MIGLTSGNPKKHPKRVLLGAVAILMTWGFASAWPPYPPPWTSPAIMNPVTSTEESYSVPAEESYSVPFDPAQTEPEWYVQGALGLSAQEGSDLDLLREPDGSGGWIETLVEDEVTKTWDYSVGGEPVTQILGPCVLLAVCVWDDTWDPNDLSAEAQARNDPAVQDSVTINIIDR